MNAKLYFNKAPRNMINKSDLLSNASSSITVRYKETTNKLNPDIIISKDINVANYNYIKVTINSVDRYYFIESYDMAQQYYILHCHEDVLMTFKSDIMNTECIVTKNKSVYNLYLNDDKMKLYAPTRTLTFKFPSGFRSSGSKTANMILTINGGGNFT